jgi:UMF1 family MFS transporter
MTPRVPDPQDVPPYRPHLLRNASSQSKLSVPLSSQSNEADDEQSLSDSYDMESNHAPQYEDEDTRLTSDKELAGFYMYGWAAEVLAVCACHLDKLQTMRANLTNPTRSSSYAESAASYL